MKDGENEEIDVYVQYSIVQLPQSDEANEEIIILLLCTTVQ